MTLENTLFELAERRHAYKNFRARVEEELRELRAQKLASELDSIELLIVAARAEGATLGQIKKAYGTKDHRTISDVIARREADVEAAKLAANEEQPKAREWFKLEEDVVQATLHGQQAELTWSTVDGNIMLLSDTPLWNEDFTIRNEAVAALDGKTEADSEEVQEIARAIRRRG